MIDRYRNINNSVKIIVKILPFECLYEHLSRFIYYIRYGNII